MPNFLKFFPGKNFQFFVKNRLFHSINKFQPLNITKSNLIKLLNESLKLSRRHRLPSIISTSSETLLEVINSSTELHRNTEIDSINNQDFLRTFDILIIWKALRHSTTYNTDISMYIDKLIDITTLQLNSFSPIRLSILLQQISQLFKYINNMDFFDNLNKTVTKRLSSFHSDFDSHSICLIFNYIATAPCTELDSYSELSCAFISFIEKYSEDIQFTPLDSLFIFSSANKSYVRLRSSKIAKIAMYHLNRYLTSVESMDISQFVNLCNKLLSNFDISHLTSNEAMYKETLNNIFNIINKYEANNSCSKNVFNLIKRLNTNCNIINYAN